MSQEIVALGVKEHNLKDVDVRIPRNQMTVITGVSGSGKSSLAHDTLFQEGQRRYIESLSAYARQFIGNMKRPDAREIKGISPTISIDQKTVGKSPRSTVGTITGLTDLFRLLLARLGEAHCPTCDSHIQSSTTEQLADGLMLRPEGASLTIMAMMVYDRKGEYRKELDEWKSLGFVRARINGELRRLDEEIELSRYKKHTLEVVIDRIKIKKENLSRIREGLEQAVKLSGDRVSWLLQESKTEQNPTPKEEWELASTRFSCPNGHTGIPELEPRLFSFNDPQGWCLQCKGLGIYDRFDLDLIVPDSSLSLNEGCIAATNDKGTILFSQYGIQEWRILASYYGFNADTPWCELTKAQQNIILNGSPDELEFKLMRGRKYKFEKRRIRGVLEVLSRVWDKWRVPAYKKFLHSEKCDSCKGERLNSGALAVRYQQKNISELQGLSIGKLDVFFENIVRTDREKIIGKELFIDIEDRIKYLNEVGLHYLSLDRASGSLSGGESQRIRLASQAGSSLSGITYVLDEPSIGLHPRDNSKLLQILDRLKAQGNTLIVVEHDEETMLHADHLIDIGPGAGIEGGEILASGTPLQVAENQNSITGSYLSGRVKIEIPKRRKLGDDWVEIKGISKNNIQNLNIKIPLGGFVCVTGVSGSGKSTLLHDALSPALMALTAKGEPKNENFFKSIEGLDSVEKGIYITQDPIGRTPRSNPGTYTKVFDEIRVLFSMLSESKLRGYTASRFSFNVNGGRCEDCDGSGYTVVEMQLLPDVMVSCESCKGQRFNPATLEVHYKGKNIAEVLDLSISEAYKFFESHHKIHDTLKVLENIGLGYIKLGQPSTTLSGGEAQRMKLASELRKKTKGHTLYLMDEPTTGLHYNDIKLLLSCIQELVDRGNSVLVIEHNLDVIKSCDYIIDMGPEGGAGGGKVVAQGTPEKVSRSKKSHTGKYLKPLLDSDFTPVKEYLSLEPKAKFEVNNLIQLRGAEKNNLKNIDLDLEQNKLICFTGPSGAGKSSLAFDTLFSEGQRRFIESLSAYARRFLGQPDRSTLKSLTGLPPAIAVDQGSSSRSPRSTVATMTELQDLFRLLWARKGQVYNPKTGAPLKSYLLTEVYSAILKTESSPVVILAPILLSNCSHNTQLTSSEQFEAYKSKFESLGYRRFWQVKSGRGSWLKLRDQSITCDFDDLYMVIDRYSPSEDLRPRILESIENGMEQGSGLLCVMDSQDNISTYSYFPGDAEGRFWLQEDIEPRHFSFNSHWGACESCEGLGVWGTQVCPECNGSRLKQPFRGVTIGEKTLHSLGRLNLEDGFQFFKTLQKENSEDVVFKPLLREVCNRLEFLLEVGLGYLQFDRRGDTLSGGEAQRIRLGGQIGGGLEGVLYVLDEPTIGLHQRDTKKLVNSLKKLKEMGNTVLVIEHDMELVKAADIVVDMGPGAGSAGGEILAIDTPKRLSKHPTSVTAPWIYNTLELSKRDAPKKGEETQFLSLAGARINNLKGDGLRLPIGQLSVVSGVSGSGKSSLIFECLQVQAERFTATQKSRAHTTRGKFVWNFDQELKQVIQVGQQGFGKSPRSSPVSITKMLDKIRDIYALLPASKLKGFKKSRFSYNVKEGRCGLCEGRGAIQHEMHFLSDVWEVCEVCEGARYNAETLEVRFKGKTIAEVLDLTFDQAKEFFSQFTKMLPTIQAFCDIGLGYLKLGHPVNILSGGEAQRVKLATELGKNTRGHTMYLLDEPSSGLHPTDITKLWAMLRRLVEQGNTVVVVEHQPDMQKSADWLVDIGPEAGELGGEILYQGDAKGILKVKDSYTAKYLA
ncbi:excinuclease ABC subunit UvrA [Fibrobacterales bacterium]|nr:excinuclease ABC subunit UvrA [Fibrobacterales bacterium]